MEATMNTMPSKMKTLGFNVLAAEPLYQAYALDLNSKSMLISEGFFDDCQMVYYYTLYRSVFHSGYAEPAYTKVYLAHSSAGDTLKKAESLINWFTRDHPRF